MMTFEQRQQKIIEEFAAFDDWMMKYEYIMELGRQLPAFPDELRADMNRIKGCQSNVWVRVALHDGVLRMHADSDALIVKGLAAIVHRLFDGLTPREVRDAEVAVFHEIGLDRHISPARTNGLVAMLHHVQQAAATYATS